ncbi:M48 family metalloprotease [Halocola ammonii]
MRLFILIFIGLIYSSNLFSQSYFTEQQAKVIVNQICSISGLFPEMIVTEDHSVTKAVAYIKANEQHIAFNPVALGQIRDSSQTDWSVVSILAHEMAHHFLGHTLNPADIDKLDELKCDRFAGYILYRLGASKKEALAVIPFTGTHQGSDSHPPRNQRKIAAANGWNEASKSGLERIKCEFVDRVFETPVLSVNFISDTKNYFLLPDSSLVWYDSQGRDHKVGSGQKSDDENYPFLITLTDKHYQISESGTVWNKTDYDAMMKIGTAVFISR